MTPPHPATVLLLLSVLLVCPGCARQNRSASWSDSEHARSTNPYAAQSASSRNTVTAERLTREAATLLGSNPVRAERLLREALTADLFHGPAHNNLGVLYLHQQKYFEAASEFEWARKLLPGHPDPRLNLALTLEHAGRTDEALSTYAGALQVYPGFLPAIQALARLQLRSGKTTDATPGYLDDIALRSTSPEWRTWAALQRIRLEPMNGDPPPADR